MPAVVPSSEERENMIEEQAVNADTVVLHQHDQPDHGSIVVYIMAKR